MPRNYDKDTVYCTSWSGDDDSDQQFLQIFLDDAKNSDMLRTPGVFQKVIIKRYYKLMREGRILPEGMTTQMYFAAMAQQQSSFASPSSLFSQQPPAAQPPLARVQQPAVQPPPAQVQPAVELPLPPVEEVVELSTHGD
jgi:hypothetical protein